jgi:hypothetical protein
MTEQREPPPTRRSLEDRIRNAAQKDTRHGDPNVRNARLALAVANIVVGRMLPGGVIKGGTSMQIRFGANARFTRDLDAARPASVDIDDYVDALADNLDDGWAGFTGVIIEEKTHRPRQVPEAYVMRPFSIELSYKGSSWIKVPLEIGHDEIGSADAVEMIPPAQAMELFSALGLPDPGPVPVMRAEYQVAQKLHACTTLLEDGTNDRARDLVDLQLLADEIDLVVTRAIAVRVFRYRKDGPWPPVIVIRDGWSELYGEAARGLSVLESVEEAVQWANGLVQRIEASA